MIFLKKWCQNMKKIVLIVSYLVVAFTITKIGLAAYHRHDGSQYSCNEINADRAYAERTNDWDSAKRFEEELEQFCEGY